METQKFDFSRSAVDSARTVYLESLGCVKNQVDSEILLGRLDMAGITVCDTPEKARTIIVNTCAFIESAVNEAIDTILTLARQKQSGVCRHLIVCGCLPERYREALAETLPEVDFFRGTGGYQQVVEAVCNPTGQQRCLLPAPENEPLPTSAEKRVGGNRQTVYLKIAEGCDRRCTYCIIPRLRGRQRSRPLADILAEAKTAVSAGARELVLVAQETSAYGRHWAPEPVSPLARLLRSLSEIFPDIWIRLLYLHPESLTPDTIQTIQARDNICAYFDIPIQHASDRVLKRMGRSHTREDLFRVFDRIRQAIPEAVLRTTVLVGFPGETQRDFEMLAEFVATIAFDHLGVFVYSDGDDLPSHRLADHVSAARAQQRYDDLMSAQAAVSLDKNNNRTGERQMVLIEELVEPGLYAGRTWFQAPDVDGLTYVNCCQTADLKDFVPVRLTAASEYDLTGEVACVLP